MKDIDFDEAPFSTFAVLTSDGEWHERERANRRETDSDWEQRYKERFIDTADQNLVLTIIDCHI